MTAPTYQEALATALSAEYAAVYGYGVVGAHSSGRARQRATDALAWHQAQEVVLHTALTTAGAAAGAIPEPEPAYVLPAPVTSARTAAALAATLERRVAAAYADLVALATGAERMAALTSLTACAVATTRWSGRSEPFPGLPERGH